MLSVKPPFVVAILLFCCDSNSRGNVMHYSCACYMSHIFPLPHRSPQLSPQLSTCKSAIFYKSQRGIGPNRVMRSHRPYQIALHLTFSATANCICFTPACFQHFQPIYPLSFFHKKSPSICRYA